MERWPPGLFNIGIFPYIYVQNIPILSIFLHFISLQIPPPGFTPKSFRQAWCLKYGIRVSSRCSQSSAVASAKCLFCERFGKDTSEEEHDRKRKRSDNVMYFKAPWRTDNIPSI